MAGNGRSLVQRHRRKVVWSSVVFGAVFATCAIGIYFGKRWLYHQHLRMTEQRFVKEQIKRRFVQTQQDSLYTLYELMPVMMLVLAQAYDLDSIVNELNGKKLQKKLSRKEGDADAETRTEGLSSGMSATTPGGSLSQANNANDVKTVDKSAATGGASAASNSQLSHKTKAELWNELKLKSITKIVVLSYTVSLLMLLTRLQLNILARREYLETAINSAMEKERGKQVNSYSLTSWVSKWFSDKGKSDSDGNPLDSLSRNSDLSADTDNKSVVSSMNPVKSRYVNEQAFLSLSWWLLNHGYLQYKSIIEQLVKEEFQQSNPRDTMTMDEFSEKVSKIFVATNKQFFQQPPSNEMFISCLLPEPNLERFVLQQTLEPDALKQLYEDNLLFKQLLQETNKCLQSPGTWIVLESLIDETFHCIMDQIETNVNSKSRSANTKKEQTTGPEQKIQEVADQDPAYQIALFSIAAKDCSKEMLKSGIVSMNNKFLQKLHSLSALDDLSACVYSNFGL